MEVDSHIKFLGIPVTGDIDTFKKSLTKQNFEVIENARTFINLRGYIGKSAVRIYAFYSPVTNLVYKVTLVITRFEYDDYKLYCSDYLDKHIKCNYIIETFNYLSNLLSTKYNLIYKPDVYALHVDTYTDEQLAYYIYAQFENENGTIKLEITRDGNYAITYCDNINMRVKEREQEEFWLKQL